MKIFFLLVLVATLGILAGIFFVRLSSPKRTQTTRILQPQVTPSSKIVKAPLTPDVPKTLEIPKIDVDASVEQVRLDQQNRMDVPKSPDDVGWYDLGVKPGQKGNAVIDGHLDLANGAPAVFWNLKNLAPGDEIDIVDRSNQDFVYKVTDVKSYAWNQFPLNQVFGPNSQAMLDLITCEGVWDESTHNYSNREVIYSQLISTKKTPLSQSGVHLN